MRYLRIDCLVLVLAVIAANATMFVPFRPYLAGVQINGFRVVFFAFILLFGLHFLRRGRVYRFRWPEVCLLLSWLVIGASVLESSYMHYSLGSFLSLGFYVFYLLAIRQSIIGTLKNTKSSHVVLSILAMHVILVAASCALVVGLHGGMGFRADFHSGETVNPNEITKATLSVLPIALFFLGISKSLIRWSFWFLICVCLLAELVASGSRSGLAVFAVLAALIFIYRRKFFFDVNARHQLLLIGVIGIAAAMPYVLSTRGGDAVSLAVGLFHNPDLASHMQVIGSTRFDVYRFGFEMLPHHWLFGMGYDSDRFAFAQATGIRAGQTGMPQHMDLLRIWLGAGVFAFVFFAAFLWGIAQNAIRALKNRPFDRYERSIFIALLLSFLGQVLLGLFNPTFTLPYLWLIAGVLLGLCSGSGTTASISSLEEFNLVHQNPRVTMTDP